MADETSTNTPAMALLKGSLFTSLMESTGKGAQRDDGMAMSGREQKEQLRALMQERKVEEVKIAELEGRLRHMILDVLRPMVARTTSLQTHSDQLQEQLTQNTEQLKVAADTIRELTDRSDVMVTFKEKLQQFTDHSFKTDAKLDEYKRIAVLKIEQLEHSHEMQELISQKLDRNLGRLVEDLGMISRDVRGVRQTIEVNATKAKDNLNKEMKRVNVALDEVKYNHDKTAREIWGPDEEDEIDDLSPPSLRCLDKHRKTMNGQLQQAILDIGHLRRLDHRVEGILEQLVDLDAQMATLTDKESNLRKTIERLVLDTEQENKRVSNLMAAFTANLMQDVRQSFSQDIQGLHDTQSDIQKFCNETRVIVGELEASVGSTAKNLEAAWKEVRVDIEGLDTKRRRDKKGVDERIQFIKSQTVSAADVTEKMLRGLENLSGVLSLVLQSQSVAVVLTSQDFNDRLKTPYVGVHSVSDKKKNIALRQGGLDPRTLFRILYKPEPATFQGNSFQRPELLALCDKFLTAAHDLLQQGPVARQKKNIPARDNSPDALAHYMPHMTSGDEMTKLPSGRQSVPMVPRSGSRGQPGARGSPLLGDCQQPQLPCDGRSTPCLGTSMSTRVGWETAEPQESVMSTADGSPAGHLMRLQTPADARPDTANTPGTRPRLPTLKGGHTDGRCRSSTPGPATMLHSSRVPGTPNSPISART